ncbi:hypothetical protein FB45DRAFT_997754 [Roridomyces roridus]|uniref:Uncharacterized protein n=1 Tax=Roridomyces roridus TaxID=1738132 RepID=A0AAD7FZF4_9AGAR|nr:hypothetical protein FB45DRAFT_997754 [Roridomyces roridus]
MFHLRNALRSSSALQRRTVSIRGMRKSPPPIRNAVSIRGMREKPPPPIVLEWVQPVPPQHNYGNAPRPNRWELYKDWYTTSNPPWQWSADWKKWHAMDYFEPPERSPCSEDRFFSRAWNTRIEGLLAEEFGVQVDVDRRWPLEPIFYYPLEAGDWFLFTSGGKYYFYDDGGLLRYNWEYKDIEDFAARFREEEKMSKLEEFHSLWIGTFPGR